MTQLRKPAVAGLFYPSNPQKLKNEVLQLLNTSLPSACPSNVFGIISPHAGYIYSGSTAAYGFNILKEKKIKTVIIISPSHREYFPGVSIYNGDGYETPLGVVPINQEMADNLIEGRENIFRGIEGHGEEHAIEVQLPFLQCVLDDFSIVPVVMGDQGKIFVEALANSLNKVMDENTLLLASSDLSHYYTSTEAEKKDSIIEKDINDFNLVQLANDIVNNNCEACGAGPILTVMKTAELRNITKSSVIHRTHSGNVSGDYEQVVGYLSAVFYGE